jgi:hypothetical protein
VQKKRNLTPGDLGIGFLESLGNAAGRLADYFDTSLCSTKQYFVFQKL